MFFLGIAGGWQKITVVLVEGTFLSFFTSFSLNTTPFEFSLVCLLFQLSLFCRCISFFLIFVFLFSELFLSCSFLWLVSFFLFVFFMFLVSGQCFYGVQPTFW